MTLTNRKTGFFMFITLVLFTFFLVSLSVSAAETSDEKVDFVLVLDCTESMLKSDINNICEAAAKMFSDLTPSNNARVAIVAFGDTWSTSYEFKSTELSDINNILGSYERTRIHLSKNLTEVSKIDIRKELKDAIHNSLNKEKTARTHTYIGGGLITALDVLYQYNSKDAAILLISDGRLCGFDDKNLWNITNAELVDYSIEIAKKKNWPIYSIELNDDGMNTNSSAAKKIFNNLSSITGGITKEITESKMDQLVDGFIGIYSEFMESDSTVQEATINNGYCDFKLSIPEVTSETNIIITGGSISSVSINGKSYASDMSDEKIYFVKNQDEGKYTLFKLLAPDSGNINIRINGTNDSKIKIQSISMQDLPIGFECTPADGKLIRNTKVDFYTYLAEPESGNPVTASSFYKDSSSAVLIITNKETGKSQTLNMDYSNAGYKTSYLFEDAGIYIVKVMFESDSFRGGVKEYSRTITIENYGFKTILEGNENGDVLAREEEVKVLSYFTESDGKKITGQDIYKNDEAVLTVYNNDKIVGTINMDPTGDCYSAVFRLTGTGTYRFSVTSEADCLHGNPVSVVGNSDDYTTIDFIFEVETRINIAGGDISEFKDGSTYAKNGTILFNAGLKNADGKIITGSDLFTDDRVSVTVFLEKDGSEETLSSFKMKSSEDKSCFTGEWKITRAGQIRIFIDFKDDDANSEAKNITLQFTAENIAPELLKEYKDSNTVYVGTIINLPIGEYFYDANGDTLNLIVDISKDNPDSDISWKLSDDGGTMIINAGGRTTVSEINIRADDGDEKVHLSFTLNVENRPPEALKKIDVPHIIMNPPLFMSFKNYTESCEFYLTDYYKDPDNLPLTYVLSSTNESVTIDEAAGILYVSPTKVMDEKFILTVYDSDMEFKEVKFIVKADNWWIFYLKPIVISCIVLFGFIVLGIYIKKKEGRIGRVIIESINFGNFNLNDEINGKPINQNKQKLITFCRLRIKEGNGNANTLESFLGEDKKAVIIGHMLFGKTIKIKNLKTAANKQINDNDTNKKNIKLHAGDRLALTYRNDNQDLTIIVKNNN